MRPQPTVLGLAAALAASALPAGAQSLGPFEGTTDIGQARAGSTTYDPEEQSFLIAGSGANMWDDRDEFHFAWKRMRGDFILRTRAHLVGDGVDPHRKMGWTVRPSLEPGSAHVTAAVHGDGLTSLQFRRTPGGETEEIASSIREADVIQLERRGGRFIMSVARMGQPFVSEEIADVDLGDDVYVGLFVCAHNPEVIEQATFRDVRIIVPAAQDYTPYRDYLGANLEILDLETRSRRIVYSTPQALQAPNWTPDGAALIYNVDGRIYRFELASGESRVIDTGAIIRNNNDHVISFDGAMLGISSASPEGEPSIIYTVPIQGGVPRRVTANAPSYLHGWSPDGKYLVYTGGRDGEFDVYRVPSEGGEETRLTTAEGLDDGPEYTPDGEWIYFNSSRTGKMQIWRMRPDGSDQQQVTNDEYNNWFPHISPDGRWIVFLSYGPEVEADDHPWYKQVYLRLMPAEGGEAEVIAYVYGGQGTINVPSWSPDSRRIAFVSNSAMPATLEN